MTDNVSVTSFNTSEVPLDAGHFKQIPDSVPIERTYNPLKHREEIEHIRVTSQQGAIAAVTIARIAKLLLEITGILLCEDVPEKAKKHYPCA
ncbi:MAG: hypothetical protein NTX75_16440 [Proteobacteria bacterium]|nr:hypothetical protein [Pseudomonadota bacterium]